MVLSLKAMSMNSATSNSLTKPSSISALGKQDPDPTFQQLIYILQCGYTQKNNDAGKVVNIETDGFVQIGYDLFNTEDDDFIEYLRETIVNDARTRIA